VVDVNSCGPLGYVQKSAEFTSLLLDPMLDLSDHEGGEENESLRARNEAEGLVGDDAGSSGEMRQRHPEQKESAQDVQFDEADTRFLTRHGISAGIVYNFGLGAGRSRALHCEEKPWRPCEPSQKGLLSAIPQRQSEMTDRPARPNELPSESTIVNSPSIRIGPLLMIVTFAAMLHRCYQRNAGSFL
jgi:hypothetical protein